MLFMLIAEAHMQILVPDNLFPFAKPTHNYLLRRQNCTHDWFKSCPSLITGVGGSRGVGLWLGAHIL